MIQIDGLSQRRLEEAQARGAMPFLRRLAARERYVLHPLYAGLPSNTPAVQGELFYGVRGAVPAFCFLDRTTGRVFRMFDPPAAAAIEARLQQEGSPLLAGGSAYANIFTGGAAEAHYCAASTGWRTLLWAGNPLTILCFWLLHLDVVLRIGVLMALEFLLAVFDGARGMVRGAEQWLELLFILARLGPVILLRELVALGACIDAARGLPVIHLNFVGYDDHAHRRGHTTAFARWPLRGIDSAIARIWRAAHQSRRREYDVWIYADHGQEETVPYAELTGQPLPVAIRKVCEGILADQDIESHGEYEYDSWQRPFVRLPALPPTSAEHTSAERPNVLVTAMGPVGHIYPPTSLDAHGIDVLAQRLVTTAGLPLVCTVNGAGEVQAWTEAGTYRLPEEAQRIVGADHPFLADVVQDLIALCRHPNAGALVIFGWRAGVRPISFPVEHGAHAGFGPEETRGFALLPSDAPLPARDRAYLRPLDLREAAQRLLGRVPHDASASWRVRPPRTFRIMTYNIHRCIGMDGRYAPGRIARIIAQQEPDLVALQEVDVGRRRTEGIDQAELIAKTLAMSHHFHPVISLAEGRYGNALLSRYPLHVVREARLPQLVNLRYLEPRGALWVRVDIDGIALQILSCHLSVWPYERFRQAQALLGPEWLGHPDCRDPIVLCGDLNALPGTSTYLHIAGNLRDVQHCLPERRPQNTWYSRYPMSCPDHVFISPSLNVIAVHVPGGSRAQRASDHLPLVADLQLR